MRIGAVTVAIGVAASFAVPVHAAPRDARTVAAHAVLERLIGTRASEFDFRLVPARSGDRDSYSVTASRGRVTVIASSPVALVRGAYAYLEGIGAASVSWEGDRIALPARLPDRAARRVATAFAHRLYLNTCTFGYTTPYWDWPRWQREIDWMALHGIDMPLAMEGQEAVWQALWQEQGLSAAEVGDHLSAPPFLPWQRMGNIAGYRAPLPQRWIGAKRDLQRRILARMRALGMQPVLPAFAGYVPKAFADRHPNARIYRMRAWEGFPPTYWLDPADPLFATLAARYQRLYRETYGAGRYYLADAFNEMIPPVADDGGDAQGQSYGDSTANSRAAASAVPAAQRDRRLADYGRRLYRSIVATQPDAVWVMQGWLFGADKNFWTPDAIKAFLSAVPDDRMLILDIGNDRYPGVWRNSSAFDGKSWVYGYVHNYGGSNPVYGDLDFYARDVAAVQADPGRGRLAGFGMFPEGLHSNSIVYDRAYDAAWPDRQDGDWLVRHFRARYGEASPALLTAWRAIEQGVYRTRYWSPRWWNERAGAYLLFKRPTATVVGFDDRPGDMAALRRGIDGLLALPPASLRAPLLVQDLVDLTRHYATMAIDRQIQRAVAAYTRRDLAEGDRATAQVRRMTLAVDHLLGNQQETLADWTDAARAAGTTPAEATYHLAAAKAQIGVWGGEGHLADYASKAWQGMYADYYLPRWSQFLADIRAAAVAGRPFDDTASRARIAAWEAAWAQNGARYRRARPADPVGEARAIMTALP
nr:alpha-N-acetylglucosaminidase [Sphingomonas jinjuensis]